MSSKPRTKPKAAKKHGQYRSGLEKKFAELLPRKQMSYEPFDLPYVTYRNYKPDFVDKRTGILIECKGFFRDGDLHKYKSIRDTEGVHLVFLLSDPNKKVRKGAKLTMGQWCDKEGFAHFTLNNVDELVKYVDAY